jgi:C4-type Zn-finger protein
MTEISIARAMFSGQPNCPICGNLWTAHTLEEEVVCGLKEQHEAATSCCPVCDRTFGAHSHEEMRACVNKARDIKLKDVHCPICNKPVLEHSHEESAVCFEKHKQRKL